MQLYLGKMDLSQLSIKVQLLCVSRSEANGATLKVYAEHTEKRKDVFFYECYCCFFYGGAILRGIFTLRFG